MAQSRVQTQTTIERFKKEKNALERAILEQFKKLNKAVKANDAPAEYSEIQDQIRDMEQRVSDLRDQIATQSSLVIDEAAVRKSLSDFDAVWKALSPDERAGAMQQIVEAISYDGQTQELSISYHPTGIKTFGQEHQIKDGVAAC